MDRPKPSFEFSGGNLCLDFANTSRHKPGVPPRENLITYSDLLAWGEQASVLTKADARQIRRGATVRPEEAGAGLARARALRDAIYAIFSAVASGRKPAAAELASLNHAAAEAWTHFQIVPRDEGFVWEAAPPRDETDFDLVLWPVARSAAELLTSDDVRTVRECAMGTCSWLFLDRSRNQKRRWCDMKVCGNRSKARRHYQKRRMQAG